MIVADLSSSSVIRVEDLGIGLEELDLRISRHILGSPGLTGMRYTGKKLFLLSNRTSVHPPQGMSSG
jgi:hypothetical protein